MDGGGGKSSGDPLGWRAPPHLPPRWMGGYQEVLGGCQGYLGMGLGYLGGILGGVWGC